MKNSYYTWFITALMGGAGAYLLVDANDSVRNLLSVLTFFAIALYGEAEMNKERQKEINTKLWKGLQDLESRLEGLKTDVDCKDG